MPKHLKISIIPTVSVHVYLQAYNLLIYGSNLGGSSWSMIFSKRKLLQDIQALARLQYQVV